MEPGDVDGLGGVVKVPDGDGTALVGGEELRASSMPTGGENVSKVVFLEGTKDGLWFPSEGIP